MAKKLPYRARSYPTVDPGPEGLGRFIQQELNRIETAFQFPLVWASVAVPTNANAAAAGVPVDGFYRDTANPAKIYVRTA